jgi:hypothetical protein
MKKRKDYVKRYALVGAGAGLMASDSAAGAATGALLGAGVGYGVKKYKRFAGKHKWHF